MNVTPLVDVVLVLLIIFMVVTPQLQAGVAVDIPQAKNIDTTVEAKLDPLTVSLATSGAFYVDKDAVAADQLLLVLKTIHDRAPEKKVVLKADRAVAYVRVRQLFKECQEIGFPGVSLQVLDSQKKKE